MAQRRQIILFWILFLVPALVMAWAAAQMLTHEQERIRGSARAALTDQARAAAHGIHLTLDSVKENLIRGLEKIPPQSLGQTLVAWEQANPLVRNVFVYDPDHGLAYPEQGLAATLEERRFTARFQSLFTGRIPFDALGPAKPEEQEKPLADARIKTAASRELILLSKAAPKASLPSMPENQTGGILSGWLPWFSENHLHILIWVKRFDPGLVYGVELELAALLSRLVVDFPALEAGDAALVLTDGSLAAVHQAGRLDLSQSVAPADRIPVSGLLPHWQIAVYTNGAASAKGFYILSLMLVGVFLAAIVSAGILLTRMTLAHIRDARQKTSFVASVSHELKTPLTSIRLYAELLLSGRVRGEQKQKTYLSVILDESERLTRLINNVLDFGRLEQGKKAYQITDIDLNVFLADFLAAHQIRIQQQGLEIITRNRNGPGLKTRFDRDALEQVMLNLVDNALKYASQGRYILFLLNGDLRAPMLKVCDDGPGIPEGSREKIFEKFYRIDNSLTAVHPGSGLGLSIARKMMQDLGGDLVYEPAEGRGSCFVLVLPPIAGPDVTRPRHDPDV